MGKENFTSSLGESIHNLFVRLKENDALATALEYPQAQEGEEKLFLEGFPVDGGHELSLDEKHQRLDQNTAALVDHMKQIYPNKRIEEKSVCYHYIQELKGKFQRNEIDDPELKKLLKDRETILASMNFKKGQTFQDAAGFSHD